MCPRQRPGHSTRDESLPRRRRGVVIGMNQLEDGREETDAKHVFARLAHRGVGGRGDDSSKSSRVFIHSLETLECSHRSKTREHTIQTLERAHKTLENVSPLLEDARDAWGRVLTFASRHENRKCGGRVCHAK